MTIEVARELPEVKGIELDFYRDENGEPVPQNVFWIKDSSGIYKALSNVVVNLDWHSKIITRKKTAALGRELRARNNIVVATTGVYDLIHNGHMRYTDLGRALGTALVMLINSDRSVRAYKGPSRPLQEEERRAEALAHQATVSNVIIFPEDHPTQVLADLRPHRFLCIDENWEHKVHTRPDVLNALSVGADVFVSPRQDPSVSTTFILEKIALEGQRDLIKEFHDRLNRGNGSKNGAV